MKGPTSGFSVSPQSGVRTFNSVSKGHDDLTFSIILPTNSDLSTTSTVAIPDIWACEHVNQAFYLTFTRIGALPLGDVMIPRPSTNQVASHNCIPAQSPVQVSSFHAAEKVTMRLIETTALVTGLFAASVVAQDAVDMPPGSVESLLAILKDPAMMVYVFSEGNWRCDGEVGSQRASASIATDDRP